MPLWARRMASVMSLVDFFTVLFPVVGTARAHVKFKRNVKISMSLGRFRGF